MSAQDVQDWIRREIAGNDVVLFMKGNKTMPHVNVLEDMGVREGIKAYSNWPTIPQLYVKGEFVGGCDIVREMFQAGELQELLTTKGVAHNQSTMTA